MSVIISAVIGWVWPVSVVSLRWSMVIAFLEMVCVSWVQRFSYGWWFPGLLVALLFWEVNRLCELFVFRFRYAAMVVGFDVWEEFNDFAWFLLACDFFRQVCINFSWSGAVRVVSCLAVTLLVVTVLFLFYFFCTFNSMYWESKASIFVSYLVSAAPGLVLWRNGSYFSRTRQWDCRCTGTFQVGTAAFWRRKSST
jgi:hypothetical protein